MIQFKLAYQYSSQFGSRIIKFNMSRRDHSGPRTCLIPENIANQANVIAKAAKMRYMRQKERSNKPIYFLKNTMLESSYEQAKRAQTIERNLSKALRLYSKSASEGEKIDSCIKDFASVLHQMGYTKEAVQFLLNMREYYDGDIQRYDRLSVTLGRQLVPSGKHECRSILFELPNQQKPTMQFAENLFENVTRIKRIKSYSHLAFSEPSEDEGKWMIFEFESFSAAKKTLEKFKFQEWFGIKKYWMRGNLITCEANDGREDFEKKLVVTRQLVEETIRKKTSSEEKMTWTEIDKQITENECAIMLIETDLANATAYEECEENMEMEPQR